MLANVCEEALRLLSSHTETLTTYIRLRSRRGRPTGESQRVFEEILRSFSAYQQHLREHGCGAHAEIVTARSATAKAIQ